MSNLIHWLLAIYFAGIAFSLTRLAKFYLCNLRIKEATGVSLFEARPWLGYILKITVFWPLYLLFLKNPITLLSEIAFKSYGDKGHTYYGRQGLRHFLNDLFKGKSRYNDWDTGKLCFYLDKTPEILRLSISKPCYVHVVFGKHKHHNRYALGIAYGSIESTSRALPSRFELDACKIVDEASFFKTLEDIHPALCEQLQHRFGM